MSDNEMRERLREFSVAEIKKIIRKHNLHAHIKLGQKKEALIENIIKHYKSAGDGSVLQMKHQDEIKLDEYTPTKDVLSVRKYKKGEADKKEAEAKKVRDKKEADDKIERDNKSDNLIKALNKIKSSKSATDKVVSDAKAEIKRLRDTKKGKEDDEFVLYGYPFQKNKQNEAEGKERRILVEYGRNSKDEYWFQTPSEQSYGGGSEDAYAIRKGRVMIIGYVNDLGNRNDGTPRRRFYAEKARPIPTNLRFYYDDTAGEDVEVLNKAQEKAFLEQQKDSASGDDKKKAEAPKKAAATEEQMIENAKKERARKLKDLEDLKEMARKAYRL